MARRLEMDLEVGTRFRLFGHAIGERMFEVAGFHPTTGRVIVRRVGAKGFFEPAAPGRLAGESRRSVERWVLREIDRGGWPWPGHNLAVLELLRDSAVGQTLRLPDPLPRVEGNPFGILDDLDGGGRDSP